jgi:hypothetical protein
MPDHQRIVAEIRGLLRSGNLTMSDRLREVAGQFAQLCADASARLQRCEDYTFLGRRSEAVQLAQAKPPLMEVLAAISFPERKEWDELTAMYDLPAAPAVDTSRAAAVNTAFAEIQPLQSLIREHRRVSMSRAPTSARLLALRELDNIDRGNPVWSEQIQGLEALRARELQPEFAQAVHAGSAEKAIAIWNELTQTTWLNPPTTFIDSARMWVVQFHQTKARDSLREIGQRLQEAMKRGDVSTARELRRRWNEEVPVANLGPDGELAGKAAKPLEWLTDMDALLGKLNVADLDVEDINYQYWLMDRWHKYLPPDLENAYQERVRQMGKQSASRERRIVALVSAVGVIVFLVIIVLMILASKK